VTIFLWLLLLIQAPAGPPVSDVALFNQLVDATRPADVLRLGLAYESKFPRSRYLGDIYPLIMTAYASQNNIRKMLEYGEKTLRVRPDDLQALVAVSRQLAVGGIELEKSVKYARHAIEVADQLKGKSPPENHTRQSWTEFLASNRTAAEATLQYIRQITLNLTRRR
jgi:hypothetical protein